MAKITVVGLGPGTLGQMSVEVYRMLKAGKHIFLRTSEHPCVDELRKEGVRFTSFDSFYQEQQCFQSVYEAIVTSLITATTDGDVIYAVPGHPRTAEKSVSLLLAEGVEKGVQVEVIPAMSFLDPVFTLLGIDPVEGLTVADGSVELSKPVYNNWTVLCQVYNRLLASERKLDLMQFYPDEFEVFVINSAGISGREKVLKVPIFTLDHEEHFDHLTCVAIPPTLAPVGWERLLGIMEQLREPGGCPWDREQTHHSLRQYLLEETYEVLDALNQGDMHKLCEELGDLLLQIVFHAQIAKEQDEFSIDDVVRTIVEKLIRRHPHVFADASVRCAKEVVTNWEKIKQEEQGRISVFDGLTAGLTALMLARKVQSRAAKVGFDWPNIEGPIQKVKEELVECLSAPSPQEKENELGDLLFAVVNLSRFMDVDPEIALLGTIDKFMHRFKYIEEVGSQKGQKLENMSLEEMDHLWELAKKQ